MRPKNFRKRALDDADDANSDDESERRVVLEGLKFLQKQRERKDGIRALPDNTPTFDPTTAIRRRLSGGEGGDGAEKEDLVLQDTFAQETAVTEEDPNMTRYIEQELAKKRGKKIDVPEKEEKDVIDELYVVPDHLKVKKRNSEESSTQWTTGIAEVQLPIEYKLRNIEETEAAKKLLQERRLVNKTKSELNIPSSFSADYFHHGKDFTEKVRRDIPNSHKDKDAGGSEAGSKPTDGSQPDGAGRREAATDEILLERFRKREKFRVMRR